MKMIKLSEKKDAKLFGDTIFNSISVGSAYEMLRHDVMEHLRQIQSELHFKYCRFHGLFHDNMAVVKRLANGKIAYQWHQIDKLTDYMLSVGLKPFFQLGAMPEELASRHDFYAFAWKMNTSAPRDYDEWGNLIENFVRHIVQRYGLEEVKTWYFEVWNEPNVGNDAGGFWPKSLGMKEYMEKLYTYAAYAVKRVDKDLRVGGPSTAGGAYISEMIDYCAKNDVPIDFITTHAYPLGEQCEYRGENKSPYKTGEYLKERFREVKEAVENSVMPELEIHWTEWNTMSAPNEEKIIWLCNKCIDNLFGGACVVRNMLGVRDYCNSAAYWVASDIFSENRQAHSVFSCTYGLVTIRGINKATYNAYKLLRKMRGNVMDCEKDGGFGLGCGIAAASEKGVIRAIAYNQHFLEIESQPDWNDELQIPVEDDGEYVITSAKIEKYHGSAYEAWLNMGSPNDVSPMQEEYLRAASTMNYHCDVKKAEDGVLRTGFSLKPDEVIYIEVQKKGIEAVPRDMSPAEMEAWNENVMYPEHEEI